jgi:1-acyl-sn-glycerol-3-phosphate acyltransferase
MRSRIYAIITVIIFGFLYSYTAIGVVIVLALSLFGMKRAISAIIQLWAKSVFIILGRKLTVRGIENVRKDKRYILVANHASLFDIVAIVSFLPAISWFGHERLMKVPIFRRILLMTDYIPFKEPNYRNTKQMVEQLATTSKHNTVAIFPEGTRTLTGKINTFYRGFIHLFRTMDLEILPVTLNGFYELKPKNRMYIDFSSKLEVIIHEPVKKESLEGKSDTEIADTVKCIIESAYRNRKHELK